MSSKIKICVSCNTKKPASLYLQNHTSCTECEKDPNAVKKCNSCGQDKLLTEYYESRAKCRDCVSEGTKEANKPKVCKGCDKEKTKGEFRRSQLVCKECEANPEVKYDKKCTGCDENKSSDMFRKNRKICIDCEKADGRNYRKTTTTGALWVEKNREKMSQLQHKHYVENKKEIRAKEKEVYHNDPHIKTLRLYRSSINRVVHKDGRNKRLQSTHTQFRAWLDFCFVGELDINNYGTKWQVDHVIALNTLKTRAFGSKLIPEEYELDCLFCWFNTMPIEVSENLKKNKYIDNDQLVLHLKNIKKFVKMNSKTLEIKLSESFYTYKKIIQLLLDN